MRAFLRLTSIAIAVFAADCGSVQPLGPTPVDEGIVFYMNANFSGPSQSVNADVPDLGNVQGACSSGAEGETPTWEDCISSVKVMPGWTATLFRDRNYRGASVTLNADTPNLHDVSGPCTQSTFNDCASSIRVARRAITQ